MLHKVGVPLIVVRAKETSSEQEGSLYRRVLIPLDGSERAAMVLPYVAEISSKIESDVTLTQVVEPGRHVHGAIGGINYVRFKDQDIKKMKEKALGYLK